MLTTHLSAILVESHSVVQDSIQVAMDQALEQHHQATKVIRNSYELEDMTELESPSSLNA